ncbi:MAG TPA: hypothetical protein VGD87_09325 [Archangium sp.]
MLLAAVSSLFLAAAPPLVTAEGVALEESGKTPWAAPFFGVQIDAGAPDGIGASLVATPGRYLRISAGGLNNGVGSGVRLGFQLLAFPQMAFRPLLSLDAGYVFGGYGAWLPQMIEDPMIRSAVTGLNVAFGNAQIGFEIGSKHFAVTLRAGLAYVDVSVAPQSLETGANTTVSLNGISLKGFLPSARLGFLFMFG